MQNLSVEDEFVEQTNKLSNKKFCITGSCKEFKNRNELKSFIENNGGSVPASVTSNTSYLVCNEQEDSTKYKKAIHLEIPIITEAELIEMCK